MAVIGGFKVNWYDKEVLNAVRAKLDNVSKEVAQDVENDAKQILKQKAKTTTEGGLLSQFSITKSKYGDGYVVWCQGPTKWSPPFHASFLELGTYKDQAKPFMRPARKKNIPKAKKKWQEALDKL